MKNIKKALFVLLMVISVASMVKAQTPAPTPAPTTSWTVTANAVALPGSNGSLAGTLTGLDLAITPNFSLEQTDFVTSSAQTNAFLGGVTYNIAPLAKALNNISPNINGLNFRFQVHASAGESRISQSDGSTVVSFSVLAGGEVDYKIAGSNMFSLGARVDDFFVHDGLPHSNNLVVAVGPSIHF